MENDGTDIGAVVVKKRGTTDVGQWYAVLPMEVLIRILPED
jgi:hypothetical protein